MFELRQWQSKCIELILERYLSGNKHFLAVATPGAGKTAMAAAAINELLNRDMIDFVLVFSPSVEVSNSFAETISDLVNMPCDGMIGSIGRSLTYHNLSFLTEQFWELLDNHRVLVICDEIHHCAASMEAVENMWGKALRGNVYEKAAYTLSLSGTPWRSDQAPVALAEYCPNDTLQHDYIYGLEQAINDGVCRKPKIVSIDSGDITYSKGERNKRYYEAIRDLMDNEDIPYQYLLEDEKIIGFMLEKAIARLSSIRIDNPVAGGLIVASNVKHAQAIHSLLVERFQQSAVIVTYHSDYPLRTIQSFKVSSTQWIVSVGMISEGTNIPRLQVCCHLTRIKTELHFRQVLGRILRVTPRQHPYAYLYILAEEKLLEYARRVDNDLPEESVVIKTYSTDNLSKEKANLLGVEEPLHVDDVTNESYEASFDSEVTDLQSSHQINVRSDESNIETNFQRFYEKILQLQERS